MADLLTVDGLLEELTQAKAAGVSGESIIAFPAPGTRGGYMQRVTGVSIVAVAKGDAEKGLNLLRSVANRGVNIVLVR